VGKVVHVVETGQTLFGIARAYGVPLAILIETNRLKSPSAITPGQRLIVPGAAAPLSVPPRRPLSEAQRRDLLGSLVETREPAEPPPGWAPPPPSGPGEFIWPLEGPLNSPFGPRGRRWHAGIDIGSPRAQQVGAAADGEVSFAQATRTGLGNVVVLDHEGGFSTLYAHLAIILVREGETVRQGQPIGGVGTSGNATGPHLHFEIRHRGTPVDPQRYLPQTLDGLVRGLAGPGR
jgi:murein DD-endopeptidase MepM/ murein hydrolase activator NlpD